MTTQDARQLTPPNRYRSGGPGRYRGEPSEERVNPHVLAARHRRERLAQELVAAVRAGIRDLSEALQDAEDATGFSAPKTPDARLKIFRRAIELAKEPS